MEAKNKIANYIVEIIEDKNLEKSPEMLIAISELVKSYAAYLSAT